MNLESENTMSRSTSEASASTPTRPNDLEPLLIDAEADDAIVQQAQPVLHRPWLLLLGLVLVALNLRPALSSMAPMLSDVSRSLGLSAAKAGLLTTLPVLCLGLFAPLAPLLARRFGSERVVLGILLTLAGGMILRSSLGEFGLFAGSILAGASIGVIGVLLPGIVKRDFAKHAGAMTGVYTMALCMGAAMAAGSTVPLSQYLGNSWSLGLGFWVVPALLAALLWLPQVGSQHGAHQAAYRVRGLLRDPLAWQVTLYIGLYRLRLVAFGTDRPRPDADPGGNRAVRFDLAPTGQLTGGALAGDPGQGSAVGDPGGHAADPGRSVRLPVRTYRGPVGLGDPAGVGAGRHVQPGVDADRVAFARCPCGGQPVEHGPGHRLHPGVDGTVRSRVGP